MSPHRLKSSLTTTRPRVTAPRPLRAPRCGAAKPRSSNSTPGAVVSDDPSAQISLVTRPKLILRRCETVGPFRMINRDGACKRHQLLLRAKQLL